MTKEITAALCKFIQQVGTIEEKDTAQYGKFADLSTVLSTVNPALAANGLAVVHTTKVLEGKNILITNLLHTSGEFITSEMLLPNNTGGGGNNGGGSGDTGYNYDASTGTITIDITKIYQTLQTVGSGIVLSGSNTFTSLGLIVIRVSNSSVRALSRNCTHAGFTVDFDSVNNNLPCSAQGGSHGSIFNLDGSVQRGPASRALTSYNASINSEGTIITINQN